MKMRFKMMATLMALMTLLTCVAMPIQAATAEPDVMPLWENTSSMTLTLGFPDYGYAEATITGKSGVTQIIVDIYVYRQSGSSWIYVNESHTTINRIAGGASCQCVAYSGTYYRADYTFTVTRNGIDEIINKTQYGTCE